MVVRPSRRTAASRALWGLALASLANSSAVHGQCNYQITAVIAAPRCPPPFNNVPATIGTALTEGPDPALVGFYSPCGAGTADSAFVWRASTGLVSLPRPAGVSSMQAADISESGVIVGTYTVSGVGFRGFIYENGQYTELPPLPGGAWSGASAISEDGSVVGFRSVGEGVNPFNAFIWSAQNGFTDLGVMNGPNSYGLDINEACEIVGWTGNGGSVSEAFVWRNGDLTLLGPIPGGFTSSAGALSNRGVIAGSGRIQEDPRGPIGTLGFIWGDGLMLIAPLPGYDTSGAGDVNDVGQVTGLSVKLTSPNDRRAFLWQNGITHDLNDLVVPGVASVIQRAKAINNVGQIMADGKNLRGDNVTLLLTPIDRPLGDINIDCEVGVADLVILIDDWAQSGSPADVNDDGIVNVLDLIIVLLNFGS